MGSRYVQSPWQENGCSPNARMGHRGRRQPVEAARVWGYNRRHARQAARAAGAQGKFWAMHDLLYSRQAEWGNDGNVLARLKGYAAELGLDQQVFNQALDSQQDGDTQGINATPTYLVEGKSVDACGLRAAIDAALKAKGW